MKSSKKDSIPEKIYKSQIIGKYQYLLNRYQMMMIRCLEALRKRQPKIWCSRSKRKWLCTEKNSIFLPRIKIYL